MISSPRFNREYFKKLPVAIFLVLLLLTGSMLLFAYLVNEVFVEEPGKVDNAVLNYIGTHVSHNSTAFMKGVTYLASASFLQIAYGVLIFIFLLKKNWKRALEIFSIGAGGVLLNIWMKLLFHRLRPPDPLIEPLKNFSFPSGHATSGFIFYGLLAFIVWKMKGVSKPFKYIAGVLLIALSLLIGFSRLYLRMHYPSDVIAGFCIGFAWLILTISILEYLKKKTDKDLRGVREDNVIVAKDH